MHTDFKSLIQCFSVIAGTQTPCHIPSSSCYSYTLYTGALTKQILTFLGDGLIIYIYIYTQNNKQATRSPTKITLSCTSHSSHPGSQTLGVWCTQPQPHALMQGTALTSSLVVPRVSHKRWSQDNFKPCSGISPYCKSFPKSALPENTQTMRQPMFPTDREDIAVLSGSCFFAFNIIKVAMLDCDFSIAVEACFSPGHSQQAVLNQITMSIQDAAERGFQIHVQC